MAFPVTSKPSGTPIKYAIEGEPYAKSMVYRGTVPASGTTTIGQLADDIGKANILVDLEGSVYTNAQIRLFSGMNSDPDSVYTSAVNNFDVPPGGVAPLMYKTPLSGLQAGFSANNGDGTTAIVVGGNIYGIKIINDLNESATKVMTIYGDSTYGPTVDPIVDKDQYWMWILRDWLTANSTTKEVYRIGKKAFGGKTSTDLNKLLKTGRLLFPQEDFIFWGMGINDAGQNITTPVYIANFKAFYKRKRLDNPNAYIFYLSSTPVQLTSRNDSINTYRLALATEIQNMVTNTSGANPLGRTDDKLFAIDLNLAFDRTVLSPSPYAASDGAGGDALHPGTVLSQAAIGNKITTGLNFNGTLTNFGGGSFTSGGLQQLLATNKIKV